MDLDDGRTKFFPTQSLCPSRYLYHITSLLDNSLQETFGCISKFTGTVLFWCYSGSNSNMSSKRDELCGQPNYDCSTKIDLPRFFVSYRRKALVIPEFFNKFSRFSFKQLLGTAKDLRFVPAVSLAGSLVPPLDNMNFLAVSNENDNAVFGRSMNHSPCEVDRRRRDDFNHENFNFSARAVEPRTGIEFPTISDNIFGGSNSSLMVFLGSKYASLPKNEVNKHHSFFADLLREDISMSVRLVVSCNGIKISTKSLRARLVKMKPDTDYDCLRSFSSLFSEDIPIRALKAIGLVQYIVHSRDLCRAFFDMYIGDGPVSEQTKTEIGENVTNIVRRC